MVVAKIDILKQSDLLVPYVKYIHANYNSFLFNDITRSDLHRSLRHLCASRLHAIARRLLDSESLSGNELKELCGIASA